MLLLCLNPCFSGRWSRTLAVGASVDLHNAVLILVLVEDGLGQKIHDAQRAE